MTNFIGLTPEKIIGEAKKYWETSKTCPSVYLAEQKLRSKIEKIC